MISLCLQSRYLYRISKTLKYRQVTLISLTPIILPFVCPAYYAISTASILNKAGTNVGFFGSSKVRLFEDFLWWRRSN